MLKIVSFVDVITNSSTSIYTRFIGSIDRIHEMFNTIIELGGGNVKSQDVFDIYEEFSWNYTEIIVDRLAGDIYDKLEESQDSVNSSNIYKEVNEKFASVRYITEEEIYPIVEYFCEKYDLYFDDIIDMSDRYIDSHLRIKVKLDIDEKTKLKAESILNIINNLFESDAVYDY